ncbi:flagellar basal body rod protein FlgB [Endozoicomonadaceae bacterium StTr2]
MAISFDTALGIHPQALEARSQRAEVLASNIANVDTPGFKAKDVDFSLILKQQKQGLQLARTNDKHMSLGGGTTTSDVVEDEALQPSSDGNTVDIGQQQAKWARNRMSYDTSFTFLNMKFKGLARAINGE